MKKLSLITLTLTVLIGCAKTNQPVSQRWRAQEGHDAQTLNHAYFCDSSDYGKIDTIKITFNKEPDDQNKFSLGIGSIYSKPGSVDGDRGYAKLLEEVIN